MTSFFCGQEVQEHSLLPCVHRYEVAERLGGKEHQTREDHYKKNRHSIMLQHQLLGKSMKIKI